MGYIDGIVTIRLDDESKDLIRQLVKAVDRIADAQAPDTDKSFGDPKALKLILDGPTSNFAQAGEGDWVLHSEGKEGADLE